MKLFSLLLIWSTIAFAGPEELFLDTFSQANQNMPQSGKYRNEQIENHNKRSLILLNQDQKQAFGIDNEDMAFANFKHNGVFYIATIPAMKVNSNQSLKRATNIIKSAVFAKEHWNGNTRPELSALEAHSEVRMTFSDSSGIKLIYDQNNKNFMAESTPLIKGAVLSIECVRSKQTPDAPFIPQGLMDSFAVVHRLYSLDELQIKHDSRPDSTFTIHELDLSDVRSYSREAQNPLDYFLYQGIIASDRYRRHQTYNLFTNNCTNRLFDILDSSLQYNVSKGGEVDFSLIEDGVVGFVNKDLKAITEYLLEAPDKYGITLPDGLKSFLANGTSSLALNKFETYKLESSRDPKQFLYSLPPFIDGHLKARGLIK